MQKIKFRAWDTKFNATIPSLQVLPPYYNQIKGYIYALRAIGIIIIGIAIFCLLDQSAPQWLISFGFLLAAVAFFVMGAMLRKYPALLPSFLTKCSRHSKDDNAYNK